MKIKVSSIAALKDNYIWLLQADDALCVVDPGDATACLEHLSRCQLIPNITLITHHHYDHTDGLLALSQTFPDMQSYGPELESAPKAYCNISQQSTISPLNFPLTFSIFSTPGHTLDHLCYYLPNDCGYLFCADTLFSAGCGKIFEGNAIQMYHSLSRLSDLPDSTLLFPAHEYTLKNIAFALLIEPDNQDLLDHHAWAEKQVQLGLPTLPTTLSLEKKINPFLRLSNPTLIQQVKKLSGMLCDTELSTFTALRQLKDNF